MAGPRQEDMKVFLEEMKNLEKVMRGGEQPTSNRARTAGSSSSTARQSAGASSSGKGKTPGGSTAASSSAQGKQRAAAPGAAGHTYDYFRERWGNFDMDAALREAEGMEQAAENKGPSGASQAGTGGATGGAGSQPSSRPQRAPLGGQAGVMQRLAEVSELEEDKPPDAASEKEQGNALFKGGKYEAALACYSRSLALQPTAVAHANRAMAALKLKRYKEAEEDCSEAIALDDHYVKAYSRRGTARRHLQRYAEALEDFDLALSLEPDSKELQKQRAEAEALLEKQGGRSGGGARQTQTPLVARESRKAQSTPPGTTAAASAVPTGRPSPPKPAAPAAGTPASASPGRGPNAESAAAADVGSTRGGTSGGTGSTAGALPLADPLFPRASPGAQAPGARRGGAAAEAAAGAASGGRAQERARGVPGEGGAQPQATGTTPRRAGVIPTAAASGGGAPRPGGPLPGGAEARERGGQAAKAPLPAGGPSRQPGHATGGAREGMAAAAAAVARAGVAAKEAVLKSTGGPRTAYEFEGAWKAVGKDRKAQAEILQRVPPASLPALFRDALSAPLLVEMLLALDAEFVPERAELAADILDSLTRVPRFQMTTMFLTAKDKAALRHLWDTLCSDPVFHGDMRQRFKGMRAKYRM